MSHWTEKSKYVYFIIFSRDFKKVVCSVIACCGASCVWYGVYGLTWDDDDDAVGSVKPHTRYNVLWRTNEWDCEEFWRTYINSNSKNGQYSSYLINNYFKLFIYLQSFISVSLHSNLLLRFEFLQMIGLTTLCRVLCLVSLSLMSDAILASVMLEKALESIK